MPAVHATRLFEQKNIQSKPLSRPCRSKDRFALFQRQGKPLPYARAFLFQGFFSCYISNIEEHESEGSDEIQKIYLWGSFRRVFDRNCFSCFSSTDSFERRI